RALDEPGLELSGVGERHNLVVITLDDERRNVDLLQVISLVRLGERLDAEIGGRETGQYALQPEGFAHPFRDFRAGAVVTVERQAQILPELGAVGNNAGAQLVEYLDRRSTRIGRRLEHERRYGGNQHGLGHTLRAVAGDVAGDLAAASGVTDM